MPGIGLQRVGAYAYVGQSPTYFLTSNGVAIPGIWYVGKLDFSTLYVHGHDNVFLGTGTPANQPATLPAGAKGPGWNGGFTEVHYTLPSQFILVGATN